MSSVRALTAAASFGLFVFGIVVALIGAVLPYVAHDLHVGPAAAGRLFLWMNSAMLGVSYVLGRFLDRAGMKLLMTAAPVLVSAALLILASARTAAALPAAAVLLGIGGGALNVAVNTLIADLHTEPAAKAAALNKVGIWYGFGALLIPFAVGELVDIAGLPLPLVAAALLTLFCTALSACLRFPPPKRPAPASALSFLGLSVVWVFGFLLLCESGCEFALGGFLSSLFAADRGFSPQSATRLLALYWAAMMVGRWLVSRLVHHATPARVVMLCALTAAASLAVLRLSSSPHLLTAAVAALGLGVAGVYPTVLGIAGSIFAERSGTVFGILFTFGLTGGIVFPVALGRLAESSSFSFALVLPITSFLVIAALSTRIARAKG